MRGGQEAGLDLEVLLDRRQPQLRRQDFATQNRFPKIIKGGLPPGRLSNTLMLKDVILYTEAARPARRWPA